MTDVFGRDERRSPPRWLRVERRVESRAVVVRASGEVDTVTAWMLERQLRFAAALAGAPASVVADLRDVDFFGAVGVAVLLEARGRCARQGTPLRVLPSRVVTRVLELCHEEDVLEVADSARGRVRRAAIGPRTGCGSPGSA
ncbi:STAS domain-containing protein [Umezawaea beigongshangensis]|uniref:STAS domain-containing protein n=1 Tax=Umezawaea beigongshangensis TaxID=2780383 RepID=UPI0018F14273|nr:STAS domain-containing protein [Umezawaea beigongshangensis]